VRRPCPSHNQTFAPSGIGIIHQVELAVSVIGRVSANVNQIECPSTSLCRLAAPRSEIALLLVVAAVASLMRWGSLCAASTFVDRVMIFNLLAVADFFAANMACH